MARPETTKKTHGRWEFVAILSVLLFTTVFALFRMRYGFNLNDEGHSLSVPVRYILGDIPFRDEVINPLRWFDILMVPVMLVIPKEGAVLALRELAMLVHFFCLCALLDAIKKHITPLLSITIFAATVFSNFITIWTPIYHTVAADFIFLFLALWFKGMSSRTSRSAILWGLTAGCMFFLAVICEIPIIALALIPAGVATCSLKKHRLSNSYFISTSAFLIIVFALSISTFIGLLSSGLFPDLLKALYIQRSVAAYGSGFAVKTLGIVKALAHALPYCIFHMVFWGVMTAQFLSERRRNKKNSISTVAVASGIALIYTTASIIFVVRNH